MVLQGSPVPDVMTTGPSARYRHTWDLALDPLMSCKLCLGDFPREQMTTISQCQCVFCSLCLQQYVELLIKEGLETTISCPDSACPKQGHLLENEIECMVAAGSMQRYRRLQFEREVLLDPCRTWCPSSSCQAVCQLKEGEVALPQLVQCSVCRLEFCSACQASWHKGQACQDNMPIITFLPGETSSFYKSDDEDAPIKCCPKCKVYIERDEGCAQMMCKNCKHAFCWYCLESLDDDFLLIHYDKGPCRNKLGHSRASVIWHRTQNILQPKPSHHSQQNSRREQRAGTEGLHIPRLVAGATVTFTDGDSEETQRRERDVLLISDAVCFRVTELHRTRNTDTVKS
ncbi:probable E3 ubiquitin-protein ligase RNF144A-A isoform X1 [Oncorhynchus nerka]|uniref:probable E3 ubiquitin-protein ligase RNF144A-A isoform X1 n=2 Tax=Oncorhynchus nerka TaxID=8023 RepID=UPI0031B86469